MVLRKIFSIFLVMVYFTSSFHAAQNSIYTKEECLSRVEQISLISDDTRRLGAYDQLSVSLGFEFPNSRAQASGKWQVEYSIDIMDDTEDVLFKLYEENPEDEQNKIYLMLQYMDGITSIRTGSDQAMKGYDEQIRFGSDPPEEITYELRGICSGHYSYSTYYITKMLKYNRVMISFKEAHFRNKIRVATFDIKGLKEAIEPYNSILNWL